MLALCPHLTAAGAARDGAAARVADPRLGTLRQGVRGWLALIKTCRVTCPAGSLSVSLSFPPFSLSTMLCSHSCTLLTLQRALAANEMIMEYIGEAIRPVLTDYREAFYDSQV
jgi:hypothetical protein